MSKKHQNNGELISLNKFISSSGFCSRREADKLIEQGRVTINGEPAALGNKVAYEDEVEIDGEKVKQKSNTIYIAFNKPVGVTSTTDMKDRTNIISFINHPKRIFPVGRLDKDSDGLIFLTNDGNIVNKILRAGNRHEKEYIVSVDKQITPEFIKNMSSGVPILGKMTKECTVKQMSKRKFRIILTQGMNRQIRRMCKVLGYKVVALTRVRVMNVKLGSLAVGKWRYFTPEESADMTRMLSTSVKTEEASKPQRKFTPKNTDKKPSKNFKNKSDSKPQSKSAKPKKKTYKEWRKR